MIKVYLYKFSSSRGESVSFYSRHVDRVIHNLRTAISQLKPDQQITMTVGIIDVSEEDYKLLAEKAKQFSKLNRESLK